MQKSMEKTIKKLKSKSIIGPIFLWLFYLCICAGIVAIMGYAFALIIINTRYNSSIILAKNSIERIENDHKNGENYEAILGLIETEEKRPLAISIAKDESVIASYGEQIDFSTAEVIVLDDDIFINIKFLNGKNQNDVDSDELGIDVREVSDNFFSAKNFFYNENAQELLNREIYRKDYWIKSIDQNEEKIYIKDEIVIYWMDFLEICIFAAILGVIFTIACAVGIIRTISQIISQRYYANLILSNPITGGKNEFAFDTLSFKNITSRRKRKFGYAVIDITLEKYQNYCTLYGIEIGEKLLIGIEKGISELLGNGEMVAHVSKGDFLVLLKTNKNETDEDAIVLRMKEIMGRLPYRIADSDKSQELPGLENLHFKAGLYYLAPVTDEDTKSRRDKNTLNIKNICIKANIAKNSITEDSGLKVYNHDMWEKEIWERKVEDTMQEALDNEEFQVYIQPKYDPTTEELKGGEALVRWISPTEGFISPGKFIPIFERTGFVTKLDDYMISHTAKLQADWLAAGKKIVPVSVNVSRAHFAQPDLAEHIRDLVDKYPLPHKFIEIELTESAFFDDKKALLTTVNKLQEYGFEVSMDDFGSGYSSLNSLKDLPLDVLKLDADFFRGDDFEGRGEIVVSEAISLAKKLNMRIVAEGVEKKEQVDFLASKNCDMIQGFYFAKPMPADEYEKRMSEA